MHRIRHTLVVLQQGLARVVTGPFALGLLPAMMLAAFRAGGEAALLVVAIILPAGLVVAALFDRDMFRKARDDGTMHITGRTLEDTLDQMLGIAARHGAPAACIMLELQDYDALFDGRGAARARATADRIATRLRRGLRRRDRVFYLGGGRFGIAIGPARGIDADAVRTLAARLRHDLGAPARCGTAVSSPDGRDTGAGLVRAAAAALQGSCHGAPFAPQHGYAADHPRDRPAPTTEDVIRALDRGEVRAWFQPQLCAVTGDITGVEALARWHHPKHGVLPPARFLPQITAAGLDGRLLSAMLREVLGALHGWRDNGCAITRAGINVTHGNLQDRDLPDMIAWELDRHALSPDLICIEVLESVVSVSANDVTVRNTRRLAELGCRIDLDDFGTGHASISSLRRFAIDRVKIDHTFVRRIDADPDQQRMVAAILTMADQLGLGTLAEGVETAAEHARLAELGCGHVQGYAIARPMPFERTLPWIRSHRARRDAPVEIRNAST